MEVLVSDEFAAWFSALSDSRAEEVATALEVVERLGSGCEAPGSGELLLWYESADVSTPGPLGELMEKVDAWFGFRQYAWRVVQKLESPRLMATIDALEPERRKRTLEALAELHRVAGGERWGLQITNSAEHEAAAEARSEVKRLYFSVLENAGFQLADVPAHTLALRELVRRQPGFGFRIFYGVDRARDLALFVFGDVLDRSYYGDSVRQAERLWQRFLSDRTNAVARSS